MRERIAPGTTEPAVWPGLHSEVIAANGDCVETRLLNSALRTFRRYQQAGDRVFHDNELVPLDTNYLHINTIRQLKAHAGEFRVDGNPTIVGISAGSALTAVTRKAIKAYGVPFTLQNSSSTAMIAALSRAYAQKRPVVVALWNPHWAWSAFKLPYLKDSKGTYGNEDQI